MEAAIVVVWIVALVGALALTLVAVLQILQIVRHAREIDRLARVTLPAAQGIVGNTAVLNDFGSVVGTVGRLVAAVQAIGTTAAALESRVAALRQARG